MKYYTSTTEFNCGIDLHARQMYVCVMDRQGKKLVHTNVLNNDFSYFLKLVEPYKQDLTVRCDCMFGKFASRLLARFFERLEEALSIHVILKDRTALIAARHDAVQLSRVLDAQGSDHSPCRMDDLLERVKPKLSQFGGLTLSHNGDTCSELTLRLSQYVVGRLVHLNRVAVRCVNIFGIRDALLEPFWAVRALSVSVRV